MYRRNAQRYFQPAAAANSDHIRSYIYNVLEPSYRKGFSGIGMDFTSNVRGYGVNDIFCRAWALCVILARS